jgi:hypothetical protein
VQAKLFEEAPKCAGLPSDALREVVGALADLLLDAALGEQSNRKEEDYDESEVDP